MTWTLTCLSNTLKPEFTHILEENKMICYKNWWQLGNLDLTYLEFS